MLRKCFFILLLIVSISLFSATYQVNQNGSYDYTLIQDAIDISVSGDTIIVYPGSYYERIVIENKGITVTSLYSLTDSIHYINETIIDGNNSDNCVTISDVNDYSCTIDGFTIQNASVFENNSYRSGGFDIAFNEADIFLKNNIIQNNYDRLKGGGIYNKQTNLYLENNIIRNNEANRGGGIAFYDNPINFSSTNKNSIYNNKGTIALDLYFERINQPQIELDPIYLDIFTINEVNTYYAYAYHSGMQEFTIISDNHIMEEIDADIYVSPEGDDNNSGLTPSEPLQNICTAMDRIKSNISDKNSIRLLPGIYSFTSDFRTIQLKQFVNIIGTDKLTTIIDGESVNSTFFVNISQLKNQEFSNLTFTNFTDNDAQCFYDLYQTANENNYYLFKNLIFSDNSLFSMYACLIATQAFATIDSCTFRNNEYGRIKISALCYTDKEIIVSNSSFIDNNGVLVMGSTGSNNNMTIENCLFADNFAEYNQDFSLESNDVLILGMNEANIINTTFTNNNGDADTAVAFIDNQNSEYPKINIYNSIFDNNSENEININIGADVNIYNSLFSRGEETIVSEYTPELMDNIFVSPELDEDYLLSAESPCIDAGTLDLPENITIPEFDLYGNQRVIGDQIDIGCHEYGVNNSSEIYDLSKTNLVNYPNPFNPTTTISFSIIEISNINLSVYNIKGQIVRTLENGIKVKGTHSVVWNGTDSADRKVSSGVYFYKLRVNGKQEKVKKMLLLK
ncbi:MAG: FlgD immunoglobulin-like domain containing protein [Candidatus Cloacimonadota bacterium]|nr:FlgD immunoglobulin-like domain containing protein [Candidatus Cloacimonadota bacterium]